ncbi:MAG: Gfo/Idh/MocA family protein [Planctomycetota bacterium]
MLEKRFTRRKFLGSAGAAVVAAPFVARGSFLSADAPSERIGLGFIGMGTQNRGHLGWFLGQSDCQVLAVSDVDKTRREHAKRTVEERYSKDAAYKGCAAYADFRELIARKDIDAVVIATPDHWHAIPIIEAAKAKKDIYCEKPLTLTIVEAKLCIDAVRKHGVVFQTGSQQRSDREFRMACELVRSGRIGKLKTVYANVGGPSRWCDLPEEPLEPGLDWNFWLGPAPSRPYHSELSPRGVHTHFPNWRSYREYSGGGMTDWGAHHFDIAQWGIGADESGPVEIIPPEGKEARGVRWVYENGVELVHGGPRGVLFVGTDGEINVDRGWIQSKPPEILKTPLGEKDVRLYKSPGHQRDWLACVRERRRPICDVEVGARSVTVCHLGNIAYWERKKLRWDPKAWKLLGDDAPTELLDRERRDPWQLPAL